MHRSSGYTGYDPCSTGHSPCGCSGQPYIAYMPVWCGPVPASCGCRQSITVPHELLADPQGPQQALIGGTSEAHLSLEYLVEPDAAAPEVKVTLTSEGVTSTVSETGIAQGYHVKEGFITVKPGSTAQLEVTDAAARLRWCETICC